jgi:hypothetical protein
MEAIGSRTNPLLRLRAVALALRASQIRNPETSNWTVQFKISDFGFEIREAQARQRAASIREAQARQRAASIKDLSDFKIFCLGESPALTNPEALTLPSP